MVGCHHGTLTEPQRPLLVERPVLSILGAAPHGGENLAVKTACVEGLAIDNNREAVLRHEHTAQPADSLSRPIHLQKLLIRQA